ncbi:MAG: hypothetical protein ACE5K1_03275 [Acidiferrobacterales bacterium]
MASDDKTATPQMNAADLYREEVFTDRRVGTIRQLTPVKRDGSVDSKRKTVYVGQAQLLTAVGAVPLSFEIDARSMEEAVANFSDAAKEAVARAVKEIQELRREASSSIVIPEPGGGGLGGPGGGMPGGGTIQRP